MADGSSHHFSEARAAGLSPIPVDTKTKRPLLRWAGNQETVADELTCASWDQANHNIGIVCGAVSGRLICLDFEGSFFERAIYLDTRAHEILIRWSRGYRETTPHGGQHILFRLEGDGPTEGNRKLAMSRDGKVLVETRGEGGYVITAPSRNGSTGWELVRGGFDSIEWATTDEWQIVAAALAELDDFPKPAPPPPVPTSTVPLPPILRLGDSWIADVLPMVPPIEHVLSANGWQPARSHDSYGQHWVRPGKDVREGHSASVSEAGRLWVHSTSAAPLPVGVSLDALDVVLCYQLGRMPSLDERTERLRQLRPAHPGGEVGGRAELPDALAASSLNLPDDFWNHREYLSICKQAALAARVSPDAVWEALKCFYAALIPWNHRLPGDGTMDYIAINVGMSGAGKTRAKHVAYNLLAYCTQTPGVIFPVPPGSGEGMTEIFIDRRNETDPFKYRGVGFYSDEGRWLLDVNSRAGNTTVQALKQLWSGELTGSVAATADRHRFLPPRAVRASVLISVTPDVAAEFLRRDLSDEGLPQRISWGWAHYPHPDVRPETTEPLVVSTWDQTRSTGRVYEIELEPSLAQMIDQRQLAMSRGEMVDGYEGHAIYAMEKAAAIHTHLDGRLTVTQADWELSQQDWEHTRRIRAYILSKHADRSSDRAMAVGTARAHEKIAENNVYLERAAISLARKVHNSKSPLTKRQIKDHLRPFRQRHHIDYQEALELARLRQWVVIHRDGGITEGRTHVGGSGGS